MGSDLHAGQRVRLRADAPGFRAGQTGRVTKVDRVRAGGREVALYHCDMGTAGGGTRRGVFYADELEPLG
ncbi:MAG TPA: hypothetical protein VFE78_01815 [Gemmataceae bacterium]|jgi:hypothetical protein|nr:hypothetical protein [Gemmataceae bacterium]